MRGLHEVKGEELIGRRLAGGRPVLGICVGMQILFDRGREHGVESRGCGEWPGVVDRLHAKVLPHMGWNTVAWTGRQHAYTAGLPDGSSFYFVHSYAPDLSPDTVGATDHGRTFAAAVARGNVFATQFHPEKSSDAGLALYAGFVREVRAA